MLDAVGGGGEGGTGGDGLQRKVATALPGRWSAVRFGAGKKSGFGDGLEAARGFTHVACSACEWPTWAGEVRAAQGLGEALGCTK